MNHDDDMEKKSISYIAAAETEKKQKSGKLKSILILALLIGDIMITRLTKKHRTAGWLKRPHLSVFSSLSGYERNYVYF